MMQEAVPQNSVAVDSGLLQAADSYVVPTRAALTDPYAALCFDAVASAYCNADQLLLALPHGERGLARSAIESLWHDQAEPVFSLAITDSAVNDIAAKLLEPFAQFSRGSPYHIARFLAFQFSEELLEQHFSRVGIEDIKQVGSIVACALSENRFARLETAILREQSEGRLKTPKGYMEQVGTSDIPSEIHLMVAYVFSVYLRGWSYAWGLSDYPSKPIYRHFWLKAPALRNRGLSDQRVSERDTIDWFPWGTILRAAFDPNRPTTSRDPGKLRDVLLAIRERSPSFTRQLLSIKEAPEREQLDLVLDVLLEAGVVPLYSHRTRPERLLAWLRFLCGVGPSFTRFLPEVVSSLLQNTWLRHAEFELRRSFRRDTIWDVFNDPSVTRALNEWKKQQASRNATLLRWDGNLPEPR